MFGLDLCGGIGGGNRRCIRSVIIEAHTGLQNTNLRLARQRLNRNRCHWTRVMVHPDFGDRLPPRKSWGGMRCMDCFESSSQ